MRRFLFITIVMLFSTISFTFTSANTANTPCCNSKMNHCSKCAKQCSKPNCMDYCSKSCKDSGECKSKCKE
ncbi:MAG: hypothetical protein JWR54_2629 [Mucilaginibacter sp.]|nr:hypothetical protein [Mucilaginibacter sp.]